MILLLNFVWISLQAISVATSHPSKLGLTTEKAKRAEHQQFSSIETLLYDV